MKMMKKSPMITLLLVVDTLTMTIFSVAKRKMKNLCKKLLLMRIERRESLH